MSLSPGTNLYVRESGGSVAYRVAAVRHYPVDFVELVPPDGGQRIGMPLSKLNRFLDGQGPT